MARNARAVKARAAGAAETVETAAKSSELRTEVQEFKYILENDAAVTYRATDLQHDREVFIKTWFE